MSNVLPANLKPPGSERQLAASSVQISYLARVRIGLALIIFVILFNNLRYLKSSVFQLRHRTDRNDIAEYEDRFRETKAYLPPGELVLYLDNFGDECRAFVLAQYSLAPAILSPLHSRCGHINQNSGVQRLATDLLLLNLHDQVAEPYLTRLFPTDQLSAGTAQDPGFNDALTLGTRFSLSKDFGHGVKLFIRGSK